MSDEGWKTVLVLGGIRSGKSEFAESLVADAPSVRYVATAVGGQDDPEWLDRIERHQRRRPQSWSTEETGPDPARLAAVLGEAKPDETLLVDDLGGWVATLLDPARQPNDDEATVAQLAAAAGDCAARLVLVSPEVGLSVVPATPVGRAFADALGTLNQALAGACDRVVLVVAGQPTWLKGGPASPATTTPATTTPASTAPDTAGAAAVPEPVADEPRGAAEPPGAGLVTAPAERAVAVPAGTAALDGPTVTLPLIDSGTEIRPGMNLPVPDDDAATAARNRLATIDVPGAGLGRLAEIVAFAAATQATAAPRPWDSVHVLVLHGSRDGGAGAGTPAVKVARRVARTRAGRGPLALLAEQVGAVVQVVQAPPAGAMEDGPVLPAAMVDAALHQGWQLAEQAAAAGADVIVLAAESTGTEAACAAVLCATTDTEPVTALSRVVGPDETVDDAAWMRRCAAVRDALHRIRHSPHGPLDILAELAGGDIAVATGVLLGAAARRLPVLLDGPVGVAAALICRDFAGQARLWCRLPDPGDRTGVRRAAEVLQLDRLVELRLDLGEGAGALAALPVLRAAIGLAAGLSSLPGAGEPAGTDPVAANAPVAGFSDAGPDPGAGA